MVLTKLPGVTERMASKMKDHFGSEEAVVSTLASGDVGRLAEVEGLSVKRALSLARSYAGVKAASLPPKKHRNSTSTCSPTFNRLRLALRPESAWVS